MWVGPEAPSRGFEMVMLRQLADGSSIHCGKWHTPPKVGAYHKFCVAIFAFSCSSFLVHSWSEIILDLVPSMLPDYICPEASLREARM